MARRMLSGRVGYVHSIHRGDANVSSVCRLGLLQRERCYRNDCRTCLVTLKDVT